MPTKSADKAQDSPFSRNFQEAVTLIEYDGKPVVVAREFGAFLDYADGGAGLVDLIVGRWAEEFIADIDLIVLRNGRLADFKRICLEMGLKLVDKRAPSLLLLTKSGMELVLARTEKPQGKTFRRWLVSEVIPAYEATKTLAGAGDPSRIEGPDSPPPPPPPRAPRRAPRARGTVPQLEDHQASEPTLSLLLATEARERILYELDKSGASGNPSMLGFRPFNVRDHLITRARMALRDIHGPARAVFVQQLVLDLARMTNQPIPAFAGEPSTTEHEQYRLALGRTFLLVERMSDGQLVRAIGEIAAMGQRCSLISWSGVEVVKLREGPRP